jgi:prephenate dehydrogenase
LIDRPIDPGGDQVNVLVLAAPVSAILEWLPRVPDVFSGEFHLLDLGSTKVQITAAMSRLPDRISSLGGHPMCGKETSGLSVADADLYRKSVFVLTPLLRTRPITLSVAQELVDVIGAHSLQLDPARHDRLAAAISHIPYLASLALIEAARRAEDDMAWELAASGFRSSTRLAASDVTMMLDILSSNRAEVLAALTRVQTSFHNLTRLIEHERYDELRIVLEAARAQRAAM